MLVTSLAMFAVARNCWRWSAARAALVWGPLTAVNAAFLVANSLKFLEGGFVPLTVGGAVFLVMATWRWGRKATFAAYTAKSTMTVAQLIGVHRGAPYLLERNALLMSPYPLRRPEDRAPALATLLWEHGGALPRNMIFVEVAHPKAPFIRDNRCRVTVFDRDERRGSVIGVELSFGFMEEPNVERYLVDMARHKEIDLPAQKSQWIVHVAHENLLPDGRMGLLRRLRFRLFVFLRLVSRPSYYGYGLGDEVRLSAEIIPVRVR
jgi:KUP system potassium uptake protein